MTISTFKYQGPLKPVAYWQWELLSFPLCQRMYFRLYNCLYKTKYFQIFHYSLLLTLYKIMNATYIQNTHTHTHTHRQTHARAYQGIIKIIFFYFIFTVSEQFEHLAKVYQINLSLPLSHRIRVEMWLYKLSNVFIHAQ